MDKVKLQIKLTKYTVFPAVIVLTTLAVGFVFIYKPYVAKKRELGSEILIQRDRNVLLGKIRAMGKILKIYEKRIPEAKTVSWLLGRVSDMANKEKIEISSIAPDISEEYGLYTKLYAVINATSTYHNLGKFISQIESSEEFLKIERINVKRLDLEGKFEEAGEKFKGFDVKSRIVVSTVIAK